MHYYLSPECLHDDHDACPSTCPICDEGCLCRCHHEARDLVSDHA